MLVRGSIASAIVLCLIASAQAANLSVTATKSYYYSKNQANILDNNQRLLIDNRLNDAQSFLEFDVSSFVGFNSAAGDKAILKLEKYNRPVAPPFGLNQTSVTSPDLISITGMTMEVNPSPFPLVSGAGNNRDALGLALKANIGGTYTADLQNNDAPFIAQQLVGAPGIYEFDITSLVQQWVANPLANFGLAVHGLNSTGLLGTSNFYSYFVGAGGPNTSDISVGYVSALGLVPTIEFQSIPEPSAFVLIFFGSAAAIVTRRRRRQQKDL